jgi:hypothetical protein
VGCCVETPFPLLLCILFDVCLVLLSCMLASCSRCCMCLLVEEPIATVLKLVTEILFVGLDSADAYRILCIVLIQL